jgi:TolB-like protein/tRNA A-37 threonylcarbamoyl transferase component Bud32/Tfp pilus assembly protein PilF
MIGKTVSHYQIIEKLGEGGMGIVYKAEDTLLKRPAALKFLPPDMTRDPAAKERFVLEAQAASALNHAHVTTIYGIEESPMGTFIAMEYVEGKTLKEMISAGTGRDLSLPLDQVIDIAIQVCEGLAAAHENGIVHRDIKADNIFVTKDDTVKILDFGIAKLAGTQTKLTKTGSTMGTAAYMSPEQTTGKEVDQRTDIWSLGVILYEMLSGETPFQGEYMQAVVYAILNEEPKPLAKARSDMPASLDLVIAKALAKDSKNRYQNMDDLAANLKAATEGTQPIAVRTKGFAANPFSRKTLYLFAAAAALAVLLAFDVGGIRGRLFGPKGSAPGIVRLAVLPFANLSGDPQQEYFSDGLTQEMISQLGKLHPQSLSVIARTSVMRYKNSNTPIDQIGHELGVEYVLEGSARREGSRVKVTAELIQVKDQAQLWSDTYEREMSGILALQNEVSQKVAGALALKLLPAEQARLANAPTVNPEAYDACLRGYHYYIFMTQADLDTADKYFQLALAKDPNYALAYAGLSLVWACRQQIGYVPPAEAGPKAKEAAQKAVAFDGSSAEAHFALAGVMTWTTWNLKDADGEWKRTVELNPNYADSLAGYSHYLMIMGRPEEAMRQIERAVKLDPYNVMVLAFYAIDLYMARRYDEAIAQALKARELQPGSPIAILTLLYVYAAKGMEKETLAVVREYIKIYGIADVDAALDRGFKQGGFQGAMKTLAEKLVTLANQGLVLPLDVAIYFLIARDKKNGLEWVERAYEGHEPNMPYLRMPIYDTIRSEPRFQALLRRMGIPSEGEK